jgi:GAF domain-containing protein
MSLPYQSNLTDADRLAAVAELDGLRLETLNALNKLAHLTGFAFKASICVISLVGDQRVRFIGRYGLTEIEADCKDAICTNVVASNEPIEVRNLLVDPVLSRHPVCVGPPYVRAYCGHPLRSPEGTPLGAVAVVDTAPFFRFSTEEHEALKAATEMAQSLIFNDLRGLTYSEAAE